MRYRVYVGPRGSEAISPLQKEQFLFKEFVSLDEAFGWARHVNGSGRVTLLIDGDDGSSFRKMRLQPRCIIRIAWTAPLRLGTASHVKPLSMQGSQEESDATEHQGTHGSSRGRWRLRRNGRSRAGFRDQADEELRQVRSAPLHPLDWVSNVDAKVHLSKAGRDVKTQWRAAA